MYQALYRKYRPAVFEDVVGQEHITHTLKSSLQSGKIFHAYLFTGTRGTGKTTCAKILAKAVCCEAPVNGEPCGECAACRAIADGSATDISEIDAASNNSVNDIRDLKEQVNFLPVSLKYRVYIIDEVHMLSVSAFNALLKTLEEPPAHVIFILATTEVHKLPATILSRCQRFDFKRLEPEEICGRMQEIAGREGFSLTDGAAVMIASLADGGMRDALSILDQCAACGKTVDEQVIADVCGIAGNQKILELVSAVRAQDAAAAVSVVDALYRNSVDMKKLLFELVSCFRNLMIIKTVRDSRGLIVCSAQEYEQLCSLAEGFSLSRVLEALSVLQTAGDSLNTAAARSDVELVLVRLCTPELQSSLSELNRRLQTLEQTVAALQNGSAVPAVSRPSVPAEQNRLSVEEKAPAPALDARPAMEDEEIPLPDEDSAPERQPQSTVRAHAAPRPRAESAAPSDSAAPRPVTEWPEILELVKKSCPLMAGVLSGSRAYIGGGRLLIDSKLSQFKELINSDAKYRDYIRKAAEQVLGVSYNLGPYKPPTDRVAQQAEDPLAVFAASLNQD